MRSGSQVECAENDLPRKVHRIPKLRFVDTERGAVLPECGDVAGVGSERLEVTACVRAEVGGELVELWAGREGFFEDGVRVDRGEGLGKCWGEGDEGGEEGVEGVGVEEGVEEGEGCGAWESEGEDG
jgi:hypothetical protein